MPRFPLYLFAALSAAPVLAIPAIAPPVNQASFVRPGDPFYGIAQGAMFALFGSGIGPAKLATASAFPLTTELAGTSVRVTVGGETRNCLVVFTSAGQLAAILPSDTPLGDGEIRVAFEGMTSGPQPIRVVAHGVGAFTIPQNGSGPMVVTDAQFVPNTYMNSFAPGAVAIAWVTGLGAASADDRPAPQDFKDQYNVEIYVGGVKANVRYAGPSGCCPGVGQIVFDVPGGEDAGIAKASRTALANRREGCHVPAVISVGPPSDRSLSNYASMSVSSQGPVCADTGGLSREEMALLAQKQSLGFLSVTASEARFFGGPALGTRGASTALGSFSTLEFARTELTPANYYQVGGPASGTWAKAPVGTLLQGLSRTPSSWNWRTVNSNGSTDDGSFTTSSAGALRLQGRPASVFLDSPSYRSLFYRTPEQQRGFELANALEYFVRGLSPFRDWSESQRIFANPAAGESTNFQIRITTADDSKRIRHYNFAGSNSGPDLPTQRWFEQILPKAIAVDVRYRNGFDRTHERVEGPGDVDLVLLDIPIVGFQSFRLPPGSPVNASINLPDIRCNFAFNQNGFGASCSESIPGAFSWRIEPAAGAPFSGSVAAGTSATFQINYDVGLFQQGDSTPQALMDAVRSVGLSFRVLDTAGMPISQGRIAAQ